ncbi:hypothetical protein [Desulfoluna butyratoxydans]|uniref:Uncharacterized protein n=1 Tax=Desulfoluna butyratoxydans TaxID=231438 RepID=A0A4U8YT24_9BACT|nr:hypothetical protein [Desulfoluna butyratoxydans]VFQ46677.1 hypothetical protein MSL71_43470 [Desulfoluna butyratoxydans]
MKDDSHPFRPPQKLRPEVKGDLSQADLIESGLRLVFRFQEDLA